MGRRSPFARPPRPTLRAPRGVRVSDKVKAVSGPIVLATDASVSHDRVGVGFVSTTGHTGLRAHLYPTHFAQPRARIVVTELRAVYWGLKPILASHAGSPVEVRLDSLEALGYLRTWRKGGTRMPEGYDVLRRSQGRRPALVKLQLLAECTPNLTFVHEKAHVGNPLNEAADSLAKLGLRAVRGKAPVAEIPRLVPMWAGRALDEHRRSRA